MQSPGRREGVSPMDFMLQCMTPLHSHQSARRGPDPRLFSIRSRGHDNVIPAAGRRPYTVAAAAPATGLRHGQRAAAGGQPRAGLSSSTVLIPALARRADLAARGKKSQAGTTTY